MQRYIMLKGMSAGGKPVSKLEVVRFGVCVWGGDGAFVVWPLVIVLGWRNRVRCCLYMSQKGFNGIVARKRTLPV